MGQVEQIGLMPDSTVVLRVELQGGGLKAAFLTCGASLQDLRLDGHAPPLVLGLNNLDDYLNHSRYFGATVGRCANRIARGDFALDGLHYRLDQNYLGRHHLHGGSHGTGALNWTLVELDHHRVLMDCILPNGHMGYPGELHLEAEFSLLEGGVFDIQYRATTDLPTLCNIAHHSYFNLTGGDDLTGHTLRINADRITVPDAELIMTGELRDLEGHLFDFRQPRDLGAWDPNRLIDHNFCLSDAATEIREVAELATHELSMRIRTTEPGLQVYDGSKLSIEAPGLDGRIYGPYAGIALEPQNWPDAINHAHFPDAVLRPGKIYRQHSQFVFMKRPQPPAAPPET